MFYSLGKTPWQELFKAELIRKPAKMTRQLQGHRLTLNITNTIAANADFSTIDVFFPLRQTRICSQHLPVQQMCLQQTS